MSSLEGPLPRGRQKERPVIQVAKKIRFSRGKRCKGQSTSGVGANSETQCCDAPRLCCGDGSSGGSSAVVGASGPSVVRCVPGVFAAILEYVGPESVAAVVGPVSRTWLCCTICHPCVFREPLTAWWKSTEAALKAQMRVSQGLPQEIAGTLDEPGEMGQEQGNDAAAHTPESLTTSSKEVTDYLLEKIQFSQLLAPVFPELLRRLQQVVVLHSWVARRQQVSAAGCCDGTLMPAMTAAALAERTVMSTRETEEARVRVELLCGILQKLGASLDQGREGQRVRVWADRMASRVAAALMSEGLAEELTRHVEQVATLLRRFEETAGRLLAFALPFNVALRARALRGSGTDPSTDPILQTLQSELLRLHCNIPPALREELQHLGCSKQPPPAASMCRDIQCHLQSIWT